MKLLFTFLFTLVFFSTAFSQNYKQVSIQLNDHSDVEQLFKAGLEFDHFEFTKENKLVTFISDSDYDRLILLPYKFEVLIDDWFDHYQKRTPLNEDEIRDFIRESKQTYGVENFGFGSMGGYYTMNEIYAQLDTMHARYPNLITPKYVAGSTIQERPIYVVRLTANPNQNKPQVFYNSLIHAREPAAMMAVIYYMYYLLENYGTDNEATYLVNNREMYFMPLANPDGYEHNRTTNPNGGGMFRKNRRNNGTSFGVDLNRNFGYMWGYDNSGSSGTPSSETYRGTAPFSEPETQAMRDFCNALNIKTALNYHTYSNLLIYPWGYINQPTADNEIFAEYSGDMTQFNNYTTGQAPAILYAVNGNTDDWMYGEQTTKPKILSMTPEVGSSSDGFWPPQSRIFPLAQENLFPNLYIAWVAGEYVTLNNVQFGQQYFNPGDVVSINFDLKNKGLSTAYNFNAVLTSLSPNATVNSGNVSFDSIAARSSVSSTSPFIVSIGSSAMIEQEVLLLLTTYTNSVPMSSDTIRMILGIPTYTFIDTTGNPANLWTVTSNVAHQWEATTTSYYTSPVSYTDSKIGQYANNANVVMQMTNPINLSGLNNPRLTFWTKWDIETKWDCGRIEISTNNGTTWTTIGGARSKPASGNGVQTPAGVPVYDGTQSNWVKEEINLSPFASEQVKLRFRLQSDVTITRDGWYLDDIGIYTYTVIPVELTNFNSDLLDNKIHLTWSTASELNNAGFEIQRASFRLDETTPLQEWNRIGFVEGAGTASEFNFYEFVDDNPSNGKNNYRLRQIDFDGTFRIYGPIEVNFEPVYTFALEQNYPNPFNPVTKIKYSIPQTNSPLPGGARGGSTTLKVYDILGNEVATLVNEPKEPGIYEVEWNAEGFSSGVYFYRLQSGEFSSVKKLILLR